MDGNGEQPKNDINIELNNSDLVVGCVEQIVNTVDKEKEKFGSEEIDTGKQNTSFKRRVSENFTNLIFPHTPFIEYLL